MGETGSDEGDGDIVLEEVSQIYRCKDCQRCFISFSKFAEHFPVYHPDIVHTTTDKQQSTKESTPQSSSTGPGAAPVLSENVPLNSADDDDNQTFVEKSTIDDTLTPNRKKKSRKRDRYFSSSDSSDTPSMCSGDDHGESALHGKDAAFVSTGASTAEEVIHEQQNNTTTNDEHEIVEENKRKKQKTSIRSRENSHDEPSNRQNTSPEALNESIVVVQKQPEDDKSHEPVEVITLSDSDDDSSSPDFPTTTNLSSIIKIEVANEDDPSENDIAPIQQPNDAPVMVGAEDNEKILEDKETLSSSAPLTKLLCKFCSKPFSRDRTLQSHMKSIHRSELEAQEELQKKDSHLMENCEDSSTNQLNSGPGQMKTSKRKRKTKVDKNKESDKIVPNFSLGFTCKWCPRKFKLLEDLKNHAYNEHIKYKPVV